MALTSNEINLPSVVVERIQLFLEHPVARCLKDESKVVKYFKIIKHMGHGYISIHILRDILRYHNLCHVCNEFRKFYRYSNRQSKRCPVCREEFLSHNIKVEPYNIYRYE